MEIKPEVWKQFPDNSDYAVSSYGRVKRIGHGAGAVVGRILKSGWIDSNGYAQVSLRLDSGKIRKTYRVHYLVTRCFLGVRKRGQQVNHIDRNKLNNHVNNLEYVTHLENNHHSCKLKWHRVIEIRKFLKRGYLQKRVAEMFGVTQPTISNIKNQRVWRYV